jgi:methionyl aminopeptidase
LLHDGASARRMRAAARIAREALDLACSLASVGVTTDAIDNAVHDTLLSRGVYPSPLNYAGFPKSLCSSVNEVICHGIPDLRPLEFGDVVSFDVSCYVHFPDAGIGVHGDNCATVVIGDAQDVDEIGVDWRGVPYRSQFDTTSDQAHFEEARRLVASTREALYAGIDACKPGGCLTDIGAAIEDVADREGYSSVRKYLGHGIGSEFHCDPFVRHYRNDHKLGEWVGNNCRLQRLRSSQVRPNYRGVPHVRTTPWHDFHGTLFSSGGEAGLYNLL